jgi:hypothetical protein
MFYFLDNSQTLEALGVYQVSDVSVIGSGRNGPSARWVQASSSLMNVLGFVPERGRLILPDNSQQVPTGRPAEPRVLAASLWRDTSIVGTSISIEDFH